MSKAAVYHGLGQGLQAFGQNLQHQQHERSRRKRQESLANLRRQWQLQDRAENREFQMGLMDRADERWEDRFERQQQADDERWQREREAARADRDHITPMDRKRMGLLEAQAERYRRDSEQGNDPFSLAKINLSSFTPNSVAEAKRYVDETGDEAGALELLEYKSNIDQETQIEQSIRAQALKATDEVLFEYPDQAYERFGIDRETPPQEARRQIFQQQYRFLKETMTGQMPSGQNEPTEEALVSETNVDETEGGLAFRTGGAARGLMDEVTGSPVKSALWGPLPRLYQGLLHEALDGPVQSFRQGYRAQGGGGLDENLLRDVAADLQTMGEEQVREELRRSGEPNPDQVIEAAKALTDA